MVKKRNILQEQPRHVLLDHRDTEASSLMILTFNNKPSNNSFCFDQSELAQNRPKRLKVQKKEKTSTKSAKLLPNQNPKTQCESKATDVVALPLNIKFKLPSNPNASKQDEPPSFFDDSTSPEIIHARLVTEVNKIKASLVSALEKIDESFAFDIATKIEYKHNSDVGNDEDPFLVKKELEVSDVGSLCRLILKKDSVESHILPFWVTDQKAAIQSGIGMRVTIYDLDTHSYHKLTLKRWSSNKSYILNNNWKQDFVKRRGLKEGDRIGLYWDSFYSQFCFSVLNPA